MLRGYAVNIPEELDGVNLRDNFVTYVEERYQERERFNAEELAERIDKLGFVPPGTILEEDLGVEDFTLEDEEEGEGDE